MRRNDSCSQSHFIGFYSLPLSQTRAHMVLSNWLIMRTTTRTMWAFTHPQIRILFQLLTLFGFLSSLSLVPCHLSRTHTIKHPCYIYQGEFGIFNHLKMSSVNCTFLNIVIHQLVLVFVLCMVIAAIPIKLYDIGRQWQRDYVNIPPKWQSPHVTFSD